MSKPERREDSDQPSDRGLDLTVSLEVARKRAEEASGIRFDKVEEVCRMIASGQYEIDPDSVAERILSLSSSDDSGS